MRTLPGSLPASPKAAREALDEHWSDPRSAGFPPPAHLDACLARLDGAEAALPRFLSRPALDETALLWPLALLARAAALADDPAREAAALARRCRGWGEAMSAAALARLGAAGAERAARELGAETGAPGSQAGLAPLTDALLRWASSGKWTGAHGCPARHFGGAPERALTAVGTLASMACSRPDILGPSGRSILASAGTALAQALFEDASREKRVDWTLPELCASLGSDPWSVPMARLLSAGRAPRAPWATSIVRAARGRDDVALRLLTQARDAGLLEPYARSGPWTGTHPLFELCSGSARRSGPQAGALVDLLAGLGYGADWSLPEGFSGKARLPAGSEPHFLLQWLRSNRGALVEATRATRASKADAEAVGSGGLTALARLNRLAANPYDAGAAEALKLWSEVADPARLHRQKTALDSAATPAIAAIVRARMQELAASRPGAAPAPSARTGARP